jgi:hypothetical protein
LENDFANISSFGDFRPSANKPKTAQALAPEQNNTGSATAAATQHYHTAETC